MDSRTKYVLHASGFTMVEMLKQGEDENGKAKWEESGKRVDFDFENLPETFNNGDTLVSLAAYGLSKKLQDTFSALKATANFDELAETYKGFIDEVLAKGDWTQKRASSGGKSGSVIMFLAQALINAGKAKGDVAAVAMKLNTLDKEQIKTLREGYKDEIDALRREAADVEIDFS